MLHSIANNTAKHSRNIAQSITQNIARAMSTSANNNTTRDSGANGASARSAMDSIKSKLPDAGSPPPKLSARDEYAWRAPSEGMTMFHNSHKRSFMEAYKHAEDLDGRPLNSFLRQCYNLVVHLGNHHRIEEVAIFPLLAHKHPAFAKNAQHEESHKLIHDGLEKYSAFLQKSMMQPDAYSAAELRDILDSFRAPLFLHLDKEVEDLKPETLRKHGFTLEEVRRLPF